MVGRPPKLDEVKAAQGNPGKRPLTATPTREAPAASGPVHPPPFLRTPAELDIWAAIGRHLVGLSFLKPSDHAALGRWCKYMAQWVAVSAKIDADDLTYETASKHGTMRRVRPEFLVQGSLEKRIIALEDRLGLTPIARQQIIRALSMAATNPGDLFSFDEEKGPKPSKPSQPDAPPPAGPVGLLAGISRLN